MSLPINILKPTWFRCISLILFGFLSSNAYPNSDVHSKDDTNTEPPPIELVGVIPPPWLPPPPVMPPPPPPPVQPPPPPNKPKDPCKYGRGKSGNCIVAITHPCRNCGGGGGGSGGGSVWISSSSSSLFGTFLNGGWGGLSNPLFNNNGGFIGTTSTSNDANLTTFGGLGDDMINGTSFSTGGNGTTGTSGTLGSGTGSTNTNLLTGKTQNSTNIGSNIGSSLGAGGAGASSLSSITSSDSKIKEETKLLLIKGKHTWIIVPKNQLTGELEK